MPDNAFECNLLARYLVGECSPTEVETVRRWIDQDPRYRDEVELMEYAWNITAGLPSAAALATMWNAVALKLDLSADRGSATGGDTSVLLNAPPDFAVLPAPAPGRRRWMKFFAAAAVLVLVAGGAAVRWWSKLGGTALVAPRVVTQEFHTTRGQRGTMTLLDGTHVALGPESRLQIRITDGAPREVVLEGEAVFKVVHNAARLFVVRARGTVTEDLGTTFGVRAYAGEPVRVVVREGAVAVRDTAGGAAAVLAARDLARVDGKGRVEIERRIDPERYLAWTTGRLVFQQTAFADVAAQLERWFDVRVVAEDSTLLRAKVTVSFDDAGLDDVLYTLARALNARVERRERWVYLRSHD